MVSVGPRPAVAAALVALLVAVLTVHLSSRAQSAETSRCERFATASVLRGQVATGSGERVVVIGDSWSVGLGLARPVGSWPSRLPGEVHVAGFSGSGFARGASSCRGVSFADRAQDAVRLGADLVVVAGGLNDSDQPEADVRAGFHRLMASVRGHRVVVVGPPPAPSRAAEVPRLDRLLARLSHRHGIAYLSTATWDLPYLPDGLHLTPVGHTLFGDRVAEGLAALRGGRTPVL